MKENSSTVVSLPLTLFSKLFSALILAFRQFTKVVVTLVLLVPCLAFANTWHGTTIDKINLSSDKILILYVKDPNPYCNNGYALKLADSNAPGADWIYSALLTFKAMNRKVYFLSSPDPDYGCSFTDIEDSQN